MKSLGRKYSWKLSWPFFCFQIKQSRDMNNINRTALSSFEVTIRKPTQNKLKKKNYTHDTLFLILSLLDILGYIKDTTGDFALAFQICGGFLCCSALIFFCYDLVKKDKGYDISQEVGCQPPGRGRESREPVSGTVPSISFIDSGRTQFGLTTFGTKET